MDGFLKKEKEAQNYLKPKFPFNIFRNRNPIKAADIFYELGHLYLTERKIRKSIQSFQRAAELYTESGESYYIHLSMQSHAKCGDLLTQKKNIESTVSVEKIQNIVLGDELLIKRGAEYYELAGRSGHICKSYSVAGNYFKRAAELFCESKADFQRIIFNYKNAAENYAKANMKLNAKKMIDDLFMLCVQNNYYREAIALDNIGDVEKYLLHKLINKNYALHDDDELFNAVENRSLAEMKKINTTYKGGKKILLNNLIIKYEKEESIL